MALRELVQNLANTLRGLLQTVRSLLQAVVSLLLLIVVALREGHMAALRTLGEGVGSVAKRAVEAIRSYSPTVTILYHGCHREGSDGRDRNGAVGGGGRGG
jgi:hypothetical protein